MPIPQSDEDNQDLSPRDRNMNERRLPLSISLSRPRHAQLN